MKIVICDDDAKELQMLEQTIRAHMNTKDLEYTVLTYGNSEQLYFDLDDVVRADVYFLDIDMPGKSGLDLADKINDFDPHKILFFYTSHSEFATQGYLLEVKRYLMKNGDPTYLTEALDYACREVEKSLKHRISIRNYHDIVNIPVDDIEYVTRWDRYLKVITWSNGTLYDNRSMRAFMKALQDPRFLMIDKATLINVDYVYSTKDNTVTMFNRESFTISRRRMGEVKAAIMKYWQHVNS